MSKKRKKSDEGGGAPGWIVTFADLMSLLLTFFILLLSFAEMDVERYKAVAGSMREALGTSKTTLEGLEVEEKQVADADPTAPPSTPVPQAVPIPARQIDPKFQAQLELVQKRLSEMEDKELVHVERDSERLLIRIQEKGAFASGKAQLNSAFDKVVAKIAATLKDTEGTVAIAGHTDDRPMRGARFKSNWELSAARAASVAHVLLRSEVPKDRVVVQGYADSKPLVPNVDNASRAQNRRVEIVLIAPTLGRSDDTGVPALPAEGGAATGSEAKDEPAAP